MGMKMVALFSFLLVRVPFMGNSYENVGRFGKSPGRFTKSSYRFSSLLVRQRPMGNSCENKWRVASLRVARKRLLAHSLLADSLLAHSLLAHSLLAHSLLAHSLLATRPLAYSLFSCLLVSARSWGTSPFNQRLGNFLLCRLSSAAALDNRHS